MNLNNKKILITSCNGLGDLIMFTPALRRIKEKFPTCHVTFLCRDIHREVLEGLPYVDKVVCIYRGKIFGRYRAIPALFDCDAIIFTDWHPVMIIFAKLFKIPIRAGYDRKNFLSKFFTNKIKINVYDFANYVAETQAKVISESLGINLDGDMTDIEISRPKSADIQAVTKMLENIGVTKNSSYILLSPFTGMEQKNLPIETAKRFVQLAEEKFKMPVVISATPDKKFLAQKISRYALSNSTTILELVELVQRAKILVTPDSGTMHVAGAVGTKCVALFGQGLPARWAPKNFCKVINLNLDCSPCGVKGHACQNAKCMSGISAEMILAACEEFLEE